MKRQTTVRIEMDDKMKLDALAKTFKMSRKKVLKLLVHDAYEKQSKYLVGVNDE